MVVVYNNRDIRINKVSVTKMSYQITEKNKCLECTGRIVIDHKSRFYVCSGCGIQYDAIKIFQNYKK